MSDLLGWLTASLLRTGRRSGPLTLPECFRCVATFYQPDRPIRSAYLLRELDPDLV
jgi:hypothetical protein